MCDGAAAHPATSAYGYAQRRGDLPGDRRQPRLGGLNGESCQLIGENMLSLSAHVPPG
jgi:hypothetical protein